MYFILGYHKKKIFNRDCSISVINICDIASWIKRKEAAEKSGKVTPLIEPVFAVTGQSESLSVLLFYIRKDSSILLQCEYSHRVATPFFRPKTNQIKPVRGYRSIQREKATYTSSISHRYRIIHV